MYKVIYRVKCFILFNSSFKCSPPSLKPRKKNFNFVRSNVVRQLRNCGSSKKDNLIDYCLILFSKTCRTKQWAMNLHFCRASVVASHFINLYSVKRYENALTCLLATHFFFDLNKFICIRFFFWKKKKKGPKYS